MTNLWIAFGLAGFSLILLLIAGLLIRKSKRLLHDAQELLVEAERRRQVLR